jgi:hypothetical protein
VSSRIPSQNLARTCPWCADVTVIAFSEEGLLQALARHLESCTGEEQAQQS